VLCWLTSNFFSKLSALWQQKHSRTNLRHTVTAIQIFSMHCSIKIFTKKNSYASVLKKILVRIIFSQLNRKNAKPFVKLPIILKYITKI